MNQDYLIRINTAKVYDIAQVSPLDKAPILSNRLHNKVLLKREDLQPIFSFKLRGAYNKIVGLLAAERAAGVIAASAGNHAQGVALAGQKLGIRTIIVMPRTTPQIKIAAVRQRGAEIILQGDTYDQACQYALGIAAEKKHVFIHPYDDVDVIAGQGTIGKELHEQCTEAIDAVFIPVGGGGLIAGIAAYLKAKRPETKIIGVEPEDAPTLHAAMQAGERIVLKQVGLFADGVAVRQIGKETFRVAQRYVDEVVLVTTDQICAAIKDNFDETRVMAEPAGALAIAGMKKYVAEYQLRDCHLIALVSGANINFDRLGHIVERYEIGENTESLFAVTIPERPGSFLDFCRLLEHRTITEFNYRYADKVDAHIFVGLKFADAAREKNVLIQLLRSNGYSVLDISENEMAKVHLRHMVGGQSKGADNERLFRFQFPERPGALLEFLEKMQRNWNISLFHYRNHGAAYGRVLVGMQVPDEALSELHAFIKQVGYRYHDESDNPVYPLFLK